MALRAMVTMEAEVERAAREEGIDLIGFVGTEGLRNLDLPWPKSAVVFGIAVRDDLLVTGVKYPHWPKARQLIDILLDNIARNIAARLEALGHKAVAVSSSEPKYGVRRLALEASLGSIGKNGLIVTPQFGPRVRFGAVLTDAPLKPTPREKREYCTGCNVCVERCPAGAIGATVDRGRCIEYTRKNLLRISEYSERHCLVCTNVCPVGR
ncbi:MAG: epoxyqueuosine reductase [Euryarchaeota archaeon]|nr:epoxyqueuosine reductase [Euryarchaeota archaeon]